MQTSVPAHGYRLYWTIWVVLLGLTLLMLLLDQSPLPRGAFVTVMVAAMLLKATLIAGYFMHLRFERLGLALMVLVGLLLNGTVLYVLIAPDALRVFGMMPAGAR